MNCSITTSKCKNNTDYSDEKGNPLSFPTSFVDPRGKHVFGSTVVGHVDQWNKNSKETDHMQYQDEPFEFSEEA